MGEEAKCAAGKGEATRKLGPNSFVKPSRDDRDEERRGGCLARTGRVEC